MNKTIKSIHEQLRPDKRMTENLLKQIKEEEKGSAEIVRGGAAGALLRLVCGAAAFAAVCIAVLTLCKNGSSEFTTAKKSVSGGYSASALSSYGYEESADEEIPEITNIDIKERSLDYIQTSEKLSDTWISTYRKEKIIKQNPEITFEGTTYSYYGVAIEKYVESFIGAGEVYYGDECYSVYAASGYNQSYMQYIYITFDGGQYYKYVNYDYEPLVIYAETVVTLSNEDVWDLVDGVETPYSDPGMFVAESSSESEYIPVIMETFSSCGLLNYDGSYYSLEYELGSYKSFDGELGELIGRGTISAWIDFSYSEYLDVICYKPESGEYIYMLMEDGTLYLFSEADVSDGYLSDYEIEFDEKSDYSYVSSGQLMDADRRSEIIDANPYITFNGNEYYFICEVVSYEEIEPVILTGGETADGKCGVYVYAVTDCDFEIAVSFGEPDVYYVFAISGNGMIKSCDIVFDGEPDVVTEKTLTDIDASIKLEICETLSGQLCFGEDVYLCSHKTADTDAGVMTLIATADVSLEFFTDEIPEEYSDLYPELKIWIYQADDDTIYVDIGDGAGVRFIGCYS